MKYSEAVEFFDSKVKQGVKPSLDRIAEFCRLAGDPQDRFDVIQVSGSNGKGTVSHMVSSILDASGFVTGLFTSPHLESIRERLVVDGRMIPSDEFSSLLERIMPVIKEAERNVGEELTYFEAVTAMALTWFAERKVDVAVLEVGMGGRWDSTNVAQCEVAVITNVELEHTAELGESLEEIAGEKAGIINAGCTVVTSDPREDTLKVIGDRCDELGVEMKLYGRDFRLDYNLSFNVAGKSPAQVILARGLDGEKFGDIRLPMIGKHQAVNAACAIAASQLYTGPRGRTNKVKFQEALESVSVPGRMEFLNERPLVLVDGAHNLPGIERLVSTISEDFDNEPIIFVVAILRDKDARRMVRALGSIADEIVVTENRNARSMSAVRLGNLCHLERIPYRVEPEFSRAIGLAYNSARRNGMVCVTGSLYTVSEARVIFRRQRRTREAGQDR